MAAKKMRKMTSLVLKRASDDERLNDTAPRRGADDEACNALDGASTRVERAISGRPKNKHPIFARALKPVIATSHPRKILSSQARVRRPRLKLPPI
jgi:hypothetical protein